MLESSAGSPAAIATNLAYPLSDLLLLAFVVAVFALKGWRLGRDWLWILAGFVTLAVADCIYLYRIASGTYVDGMFVDALWPLAMLMLAYSAWQPRRDADASELEGWLVLLLPVGFSFVGARPARVRQHAAARRPSRSSSPLRRWSRPWSASA